MNCSFWSQEIEEMAVKIFKDLIKINTSNPPGNETEAVEYLQRILKQYDIESDCIELENNRGNLIARLRGGDKTPITMLSHLDVVGADGDKWKHPPFEAVETNGMIWGRGALDTKQLTVMEVVSLILLKKHLPEMNRDITLIASSDEECGSLYGMKSLHEKYDFLWKQSIVLNEGGGFPISIGDRKYILIAAAEKGSCKVTISSAGSYGHASCPPDNLAIGKIAKAVNKISNYSFPVRKTAILNKFMETTGLTSEDAGIHGENLKNLFNYMTRGSVAFNDINIGDRVNVIPRRASAEIEFRIIPGTTEEEVRNLLHNLLDSAEVDFSIGSFESGYESNIDNEFISILEDKIQKFTPGVSILPIIALGRTDGRFLSSYCSNIYGFSPVLQDACFWEVLKKVHGNDECLSIDSLIYGTRVIWEALYDFCNK